MLRPHCFGLPDRSEINARDPEDGPWCDSCDHFTECQEANRTPPRILTLNLKSKYFFEIKNGVKKEEYREAKKFWLDRIIRHPFDVLEICLGYPKKGDLSRRLFFTYKGCHIKNAAWDNDGKRIEGQTIVILIGEPLGYPYQAIEHVQGVK